MYYSAPLSRWEALLKNVASGNAPLTSAKIHCNAAGPTAVYEKSDITTANLYRNYPKYLNNASYETVTTMLENDLTGIIYGMSSFDVDLAALKEQMATGGIGYTTADARVCSKSWE